MQASFCLRDSKVGNTSNLLNHLQKHHSEQYGNVIIKPQQCSGKSKLDKDMPSNQLTIQQSLNQSIKWNRSSKEHQKMVKTITCFLVKDMIPVNVVERDGF